MTMPWYWWLILGLLIGFVAEWIVDWLYWRNRRTETITQTTGADPAVLANLRTELDNARADIARLNAELQAALADNARLEAELKAAGESRHTMAPAMAAAGGMVLGEAMNDSDDLRRQIALLEAELAAERATGHTLVFTERDPLIDINGIGPVYEQKLFDNGVYSFEQLGLMTPQQVRDIIQPESWQDIDPEAWIAEAKLLHAKYHPDPLIDINGIGPVYEQKLFAAGIYTFAQLANSTPEQVRAIVKPQAWQATDEPAWIAEAATMAKRKSYVPAGQALAVGGGVVLGASAANGDTAQLRADLDAARAEAAQLRADLEAERSTSRSLRFAQRDPLIDIDGIGPVYEQKLFDAGIYTFAELAALTPQQIRDIVKPDAWQEIDAAAWIAEAKSLSVSRHRDPLIDIDGIGPVYEQKLFDAGIYTFEQLAASTPEAIRDIIKPQAWQEIDAAAWIAEAVEFVRKSYSGGR